MTAPAQITGSANTSIAGLRVLKSASEFLAQATSDTEETSSSEDSSQAPSPGEGAPSGHSSFGAVLRQYFTASSSGTPASRSDRAQSGQRKADTFDSNLFATVPVRPNEETRDIAPLNLAIPVPKNEVNAGDSLDTSSDVTGMSSRTAPRIQDSPTTVGSHHDSLLLGGGVRSGQIERAHGDQQATLPIPLSRSEVDTKTVFSSSPKVTGMSSRTAPRIQDSQATVGSNQYSLPQSSEARSGESDPVQTGQKQADKSDPRLSETGTSSRTIPGIQGSASMATVALSQDEAPPEIAAAAIPPDPLSSMPHREPLTDLSNAAFSSNDDMATRIPGVGERSTADHGSSSLPLSDRAGLAPDWVKSAVLLPELLNLELFKLGSSQPIADARATATTADLTQQDQPVPLDKSADAPAHSSQPAASTQTAQPDTLAFAVRLSSPDVVPAAGDDGGSTVAAASSVHLPTIQKQISTSDAQLSLAQLPDAKDGTDTSGGLTKTNATPLPTLLISQNEPATFTKNEGRGAPGPSPAHVEPAAEPPAEQPGSSRDITVRIPDATDRGTNVRFVERGSEVHVSVRTGDSELAQTLRSGLSDLTARLQHSGIQAEVWRPSSSFSQSDSQNASPDNPRDSGGGRNQSGAQRDGQDQSSENKPQWVEELGTSIGEPAAHAGS
jgi:hypothetical protein